MIPILYNGTEQAFLHNGLGRLADAITCKVTEERNGQFELEMTYPITGVHFSDIAENRIILAKTEDGGTNQAFTIYKISRPLNGIVTINAEHISYLLNGFICMPFSAVSCADAIGKIADHTVINTPFSYHTDVSVIGAFSFDTPRAIRGLLGGEQGSILDVYGGHEYKFDNFDVYLYQHRGTDNGVSIRYGKNLVDLKDVVDTTNIYTGIVPYWADSEGNRVYLPEYVVLSDHAADYPYKILKTMDFSNEFESAPTEAQLRAKAESYVQSNAGWKLKNSIDVSFVNLGQTEEYKQFAALERVKLCDYVTVVYDKLGVDVKTKVIKTVYNVLTERYDSISLGDTTYTLAKAIQGAIDAPTTAELNTSVKSAVQRATKLIQGGLGGHVVFNTNGDGEPEEILIMDTDDLSTAVNVIRMNLNGIGFSHNGYEGPFDTAWTIDGHFVADYIDTGELNGNIIKAGTVNTNALSVEAQIDSGAVHSYVPYDIFSNRDRWILHKYGSSNVSYGFVHISQGYWAVYLDGSSINTGSYELCFPSDLLGQVPITVKFKYQVTQDHTIGNTNFVFLYYAASNDGHSWGQNPVCTIDAGTTLEAFTEYTFERTFTPSIDFDYDMSSRFDFCFMKGTQVWIYDLQIYSSEYKNAQLSFTADGLNSIVQAGSIISQINQSAESVSIKANKIDLTGALSLHGDFTSYDDNDNTTYAFLDEGNLSFYNQGDNVFTIAAQAVLGQYAGIFFGDKDDPASTASHTWMNQDFLQTPTFLVRKDGSQSVPTGAGDALIEGNLSVHGSTHFYSNVYDSGGSVVFVSDKRKKKNIKDLAIDKAKSFLMALNPRIFKFKEGTSGRYHHGFIAQEVKEAMQGDDWGVYVHDTDSDFIGLRYDELIADLVAVVQDQEKRIDALERKMDK